MPAFSMPANHPMQHNQQRLRTAMISFVMHGYTERLDAWLEQAGYTPSNSVSYSINDPTTGIELECRARGQWQILNRGRCHEQR